MEQTVSPDTIKTIQTDEQWREQLTPQQYEVLRRGGTEPPFSGEYAYSKEDGMYRCAACGNELFSSDAKFESGTGWPGFWAPVAQENVSTETARAFGVTRT